MLKFVTICYAGKKEKNEQKKKAAQSKCTERKIPIVIDANLTFFWKTIPQP
jgi:hypothetical protein